PRDSAKGTKAPFLGLQSRICKKDSRNTFENGAKKRTAMFLFSILVYQAINLFHNRKNSAPIWVLHHLAFFK
ncbi:MAG: hypothetical protein ACLFUS_08470, partial [Candidatus Sumerlaeia bacterium]